MGSEPGSGLQPLLLDSMARMVPRSSAWASCS